MSQPPVDFLQRVKEINLRLQMDGFRVSVAARGKNNYLSLVATLPPRAGSKREKPHQQRISLGYSASVPALRQAETQARLLATQVINGSFRWEDWWEPSGPNHSDRTGKEHITRYKAHVFETRLNTDKYSPDDLEALWRRRILDKGIRKLNVDRPISLKDLEAVAQSITPNTAQARYVVVELRKFGKFCGLDGVDEKLKPYQGKYNSSKPTHSRDYVPTDQEIHDLLLQIINPQWRYVFGMMATFGLRDHEVWYSTIEFREKEGAVIPVCRVSQGKTGPRDAYPMPGRWVEEFDLATPNLPNLSVSVVRLGEKTARAFRRQCGRLECGLPKWRPYDLRHAYAIRCITSGLADAVSAKWMGHKVNIFREHYSRWINRNTSEDIWLELRDISG